MTYEIVMGLEVHAELSTKSKIFCTCTTEFGGAPNTHVCPTCTGVPGTLPVLNRAVVEYALRLGLALGCEIARSCKFDRKNYFYPDLPKAYQISQLYAPICRDGCLDIGGKSIRIREIHMEEDAGKLIHGANCTYMDFNRSGVPLLEIVSQPDLSTVDEVIAYLEKLRETLLYLDICDCKMQEGSLRADVNLSLRRPGGELGTRTETKNMNSFKAIARAIEYETERQAEILDKGGAIMQETRRWDDDHGESYGMRSKENAHDYRYFPEPNLLLLQIDEDWLKNVRAALPEMPWQKRERYERDFGIPAKEAAVLTAERETVALFEAIIAPAPTREFALEAAHLVSGEILRLLKTDETRRPDPAKLTELVNLVLAKKINRNTYKEAIEAVFLNDVDPLAYVTEKGLLMSSDDSAVTAAVKDALAANPGAVADYGAGKEKAFGFLMGQTMRTLGGSADPALVKEMLKRELGE
ncbi:MAG: Asp-tRNA(Asn)/Glu-tRNA(Gln) amidotransferase subunit GatB [Lachnospiraceae bacterium]|jgi:aspartyl-tRNA(Asn)/glutamyl-tRNA(Gln) amidotransferase subunit B|nr:Asp-tRNA(Asn)/Glu-tRNA(Gln) amidotransferase subunit GatB [Lachnospiraceae bacterium]